MSLVLVSAFHDVSARNHSDHHVDPPHQSIWKITVPLATIGCGISAYHWFLERFPNLDAGVCDVKVPCEFVWFEHFGFVTLPFMAFTGFLAVIVFTTLPTPQQTEQV